jgi:pimeloyl-ACP methyl ester carboxylesterase
MKLDSQQYANLAAHTYGSDKIVLKNLVGKDTVIEGIAYEVLAHVDKPSGYQGTIYQRKDSGEIVVSHRGTEITREPIKDGWLADGGMVFGRVNSQAADAIALTQDALNRARIEAAKWETPPEVTVTGHSIGGTLAQITASKFNLRGETFNAYGAASLGYGIKEGGQRVVNHVMAADVVSAASPHYGQVRMYAKRGEIAQLLASGYDNNPVLDALRPDRPVLASLNVSHMMHNFLDVDGDGRRDVSILRDADARTRAERNARMIDGYRDDVRGLRTGASILGDGVRFMEKALPDFEHVPRLGPMGLPTTLPLRSLPELPDAPTRPARQGGESREGAHAAPVDDPLAARFKSNLPEISDEKAAQLALQARRQAGIAEPSQLAHIGRNGDLVVAFSHVPGMRTDPIDLLAPAPPLQDTRAEQAAFEQQQRERTQEPMQLRMA